VRVFSIFEHMYAIHEATDECQKSKYKEYNSHDPKNEERKFILQEMRNLLTNFKKERIHRIVGSYALYFYFI